VFASGGVTRASGGVTRASGRIHVPEAALAIHDGTVRVSTVKNGMRQQSVEEESGRNLFSGGPVRTRAVGNAIHGVRIVTLGAGNRAPRRIAASDSGRKNRDAWLVGLHGS